MKWGNIMSLLNKIIWCIALIGCAALIAVFGVQFAFGEITLKYFACAAGAVIVAIVALIMSWYYEACFYATQEVVDSYREAYEQLHDEYNKNYEEYRIAYMKNVQETVDRLAHKGILAQEEAIFSDLIKNGVSAPAIEGIVNFSREVTSNDTVFLIRMNHKERSWYLRVSGAQVHVDQASKILDGVKNKVVSLAKENGLINKSGKIYN